MTEQDITSLLNFAIALDLVGLLFLIVFISTWF